MEETNKAKISVASSYWFIVNELSGVTADPWRDSMCPKGRIPRSTEHIDPQHVAP